MGEAGDRKRYEGGGLRLAIGSQHTVELPVYAYRGRLTGMFFDTAKSFLLPSAMNGIQGLVDYFLDHPGSTVLVVGHTDTVGDATYNLQLSEERAAAIVDFLLENAAGWMAWFGAGKSQEKRWGSREVQHMLTVLPPGAAESFYEGPPSGVDDPPTKSAVKEFQIWSNHNRGTSLPETGAQNDATRKEIVRAYMAIDGTSLPAGTPVEKHGCGLFHNEVPRGPNADEPKNRRAEVFLFVGPVEPPAQKCRAPGCAEYPQWVAACVETIDLGAGSLAEARKLQFTVAGEDSELLILDADGAEASRLAPGQGSAGQGYVTFTLDPAELPNPAAFRQLTPRGECRIGGPCDPFALRDALRRTAWDEVNRLLGPAPPPSPATDDNQPEFLDDHL